MFLLIILSIVLILFLVFPVLPEVTGDFFEWLFGILPREVQNFLRGAGVLLFLGLLAGSFGYLVAVVSCFADSYWQHKKVLDEVRREEEGLPCFSEDFINSFRELLKTYADYGSLFYIKRGLERLEQLVLAINNVNNVLLEATRALEPARKESDFDPNAIKTVIARGVDAVEAMMRASHELTGFFGSDIKALILERGGSMIKVLQETNRLLALQEENRLLALQEKNRLLALREENRRKELELEHLKQKADAANIPLRSYLDFLRVKFDVITREELTGDNHTRLFELYEALKEAFQRHHLLPPEKLEPIAPDVKRLDQIETLIDLYSEKIRRVREDNTLDPEEQQLKIDYWIRIRDRDITELEK